jgi:hypothetical protein
MSVSFAYVSTHAKRLHACIPTNLALHELGVGIVADGYKGGATHDDRLLLRLAVLDLHVSTVTSVKL